MATIVRLRFSPEILFKGYFTATRQERLTPEAIHVRRCRSIRVLEFDRLLNLLSLEFCIDRWSSKENEDSLGVLVATFAYQPPGGLGCKWKADQEYDGENPLESAGRTNFGEGMDVDDT